MFPIVSCINNDLFSLVEPLLVRAPLVLGLPMSALYPLISNHFAKEGHEAQFTDGEAEPESWEVIFFRS